MPMSDFMRGVREKVGHDLLVVPSVTGAVFDTERRLLLVKHSNGGVWVAPGGAVEPDERPSDAVVREVWEETGIHVEPVKFVGVFGGPEYRVRYDNGDEVDYVMSMFECRPLGGQLRADGEETLEARYFTADEVAELKLSRWASVLLPRLLAGRPLLDPVQWRPPA